MSGVDVFAVMDECASVLSAVDSDEGSYLDAKAASLREARVAVSELAKCCGVTIKAFEALGRTNNIVAQLESHRECERALIEQKAALAALTTTPESN